MVEDSDEHILQSELELFIVPINSIDVVFSNLPALILFKKFLLCPYADPFVSMISSVLEHIPMHRCNTKYLSIFKSVYGLDLVISWCNICILYRYQ